MRPIRLAEICETILGFECRPMLEDARVIAVFRKNLNSIHATGVRCRG